MSPVLTIDYFAVQIHAKMEITHGLNVVLILFRLLNGDVHRQMLFVSHVHRLEGHLLT